MTLLFSSLAMHRIHPSPFLRHSSTARPLLACSLLMSVVSFFSSSCLSLRFSVPLSAFAAISFSLLPFPLRPGVLPELLPHGACVMGAWRAPATFVVSSLSCGHTYPTITSTPSARRSAPVRHRPPGLGAATKGSRR